jgi:hypothetical protein
MLLLALRRPGGVVWVVSPILLAAAAVPAMGLLGLPWLIVAALRSGEGALWAFAAISALLLGGSAFAFGRAALAQQVHCALQGGRIRVRTRAERAEASVTSARLGLGQRRVGLNPPLTLHEVRLSAPGWREPVLLHSGLTAWSARAAAARLGLHLGLAQHSANPTLAKPRDTT